MTNVVKLIYIVLSLQTFAKYSLAGTADYFLLESKGNKSFNFLLLSNIFTYADINLDSTASTDSFVYGQTQGVSIGMRSNQIFMFSLVYRQNSENSRKTTGLAFRSYLPGFYLIGDSIQNFVIDFSKRRYHTYCEAEVAITSVVDRVTLLSSKYFENALRIGFEVTVYNGVFLDGSYGLATYKSNNTWVTGLGLGLRF